MMFKLKGKIVQVKALIQTDLHTIKERHRPFFAMFQALPFHKPLMTQPFGI